MSETVKIERSDLPERVLQHADLLKKHGKFTETGVLELPADIYEQTLGDDAGFTMANVKKFQSHNTDLQAAMIVAMGEMSEGFAKKHKNINELTCQIKVGKDAMGNVFKYEKPVRVPSLNGGEATTIVKRNVSQPFYDTNSAGPNRGSVKKAREYVSGLVALAAAA